MIADFLILYSINQFINCRNIFSAVLCSIVTYILIAILIAQIPSFLFISYIFLILYVAAFSILFLFAFMLADST